MGRSPEWYLHVRPLPPRKVFLQNVREDDSLVFHSGSGGFRITSRTTTRPVLERSCSSYGHNEVSMPQLDTEYIVDSTYRVDVKNQYGVFRHRILELRCRDPHSFHTWVLTTEGHILNCESFHLRGTIEINTCSSYYISKNDSSTGGGDQS